MCSAKADTEPRLRGRSQEAPRQRQYLPQALGPRAVRHHGADQYRRRAPAQKPASCASRGPAPQPTAEAPATNAGSPWRSTEMAAGAGSIPSEGAKLAVAEACAQSCLHRRNARRRHQLPQLRQSRKAGDYGASFSDAIDGIAEACVALGTPVTGGNVSLYNETRGEGILPHARDRHRRHPRRCHHRRRRRLQAVPATHCCCSTGRLQRRWPSTDAVHPIRRRRNAHPGINRVCQGSARRDLGSAGDGGFEAGSRFAAAPAGTGEVRIAARRARYL